VGASVGLPGVGACLPASSSAMGEVDGGVGQDGGADVDTGPMGFCIGSTSIQGPIPGPWLRSKDTDEGGVDFKL
jgi:hypothetical protein